MEQSKMLVFFMLILSPFCDGLFELMFQTKIETEIFTLVSMNRSCDCRILCLVTLDCTVASWNETVCLYTNSTQVIFNEIEDSQWTTACKGASCFQYGQGMGFLNTNLFYLFLYIKIVLIRIPMEKKPI